MTQGATSAIQDPILDSIADGVFTVDKDWLITSFNQAAERITKVPRAQAIGRRCCDVFRASICEGSCALRKTLETAKPIMDRTIYILDSTGSRTPVSISTAILKDAQGRTIGGVETFRDLSLVENLRKQLHASYSFADIIGRSRPMRQLFDILPQVASSDAAVLLEGRSGTGKELFAHALHNLSARKHKRFVAINCGALPDSLLESELFGYKAGAFTDARKDKPGRFALAEGGTIFLDEIADVSAAMQSRLLRILQERVYEPLGGIEPIPANVRIITATNTDLRQRVADGHFREDLFYRINVVRMVLPLLRERREDIPLLVEDLIQRFNRLKHKQIAGVSDSAMAILLEHEYPGNVRELQNIIEHAFVLCGSGLIDVKHLPPALRQRAAVTTDAATLRDMEILMIKDSLLKHHGNRTAAAKQLGIHPATLFRKAKSLKITLPKTDGRQPA